MKCLAKQMAEQVQTFARKKQLNIIKAMHYFGCEVGEKMAVTVLSAVFVFIWHNFRMQYASVLIAWQAIIA